MAGVFAVNYAVAGAFQFSSVAQKGYFKNLSLVHAAYASAEDMMRIRARQGHSIQVDVELEEAIPPDVLCHGTAKDFVDSIMKQGILKGHRLYVHLSPTMETATKVGQRHGEPVVLVIDAKRMREDGNKFFLSRNGVWLTEFVDAQYIIDVVE